MTWKDRNGAGGPRGGGGGDTHDVARDAGQDAGRAGRATSAVLTTTTSQHAPAGPDGARSAPRGRGARGVFARRDPGHFPGHSLADSLAATERAIERALGRLGDALGRAGGVTWGDGDLLEDPVWQARHASGRHPDAAQLRARVRQTMTARPPSDGLTPLGERRPWLRRWLTLDGRRVWWPAVRGDAAVLLLLLVLVASCVALARTPRGVWR